MEEPVAYAYSWHEQFYYFNLFRTLNGPEATPGRDCDTPIDDDTYYTQANLSAWIREQNTYRKHFLNGLASEISENQIKVLDGVSFPWIRDSSERWDGHFQELVAYKEKHGNCNVSHRTGKLGRWVKNQRAAYRKVNDMAAGRLVDCNVKKTTAVITQDQIKALTELGFQWKLKPDHADVWESRFAMLKEFIQKHGHCNVSRKEHPVLGLWICEMRAQYKTRTKGEKAPMTDEQFARLEEISFPWVKPKQVMDPEEKKRKMEESRKRKNEQKKVQRREMKVKKHEEAMKKRKMKIEMISKAADRVRDGKGEEGGISEIVRLAAMAGAKYVKKPKTSKSNAEIRTLADGSTEDCTKKASTLPCSDGLSISDPDPGLT